jgi:hypothetical protein
MGSEYKAVHFRVNDPQRSGLGLIELNIQMKLRKRERQRTNKEALNEGKTVRGRQELDIQSMTNPIYSLIQFYFIVATTWFRVPNCPTCKFGSPLVKYDCAIRISTCFLPIRRMDQ